ncbi:MAG: hypothetical protein PHI32_03920 [Dysgonamonadaceae bacterium]|nr:hypothetical protein [Dysgonamonadaceae bacterium]
MKAKFKSYIYDTNLEGSQKASSYIRAIDLLDAILQSKAKSKLEGFKSIYDIKSKDIISRLYDYVLEEQNNERGIF